MKTNKGFVGVSLLIFLVALVAVGGVVYYSAKKQTTLPVVSLPIDSSQKDKIENYLSSEIKKLDSSWAQADTSACSFSSFGNDDKYIYGFGICQGLLRDNEGKFFLGNDLSDPVRISYREPNFQILSYERPTSECLDCPGTTIKDIFPVSYQEFYQSQFSYSNIAKENLEKIISGKILTKDLALFITMEDLQSDLSDPYREIGFPNGKYEIIGSEKSGWNLAFYINSSGPDGNKSDIAAVCRHIDSNYVVSKIGMYNPKNGEVVENINPKTCLPEKISENKQSENISVGLQKAFSIWKDGYVAECKVDGKTYYMGGVNAYDGGSGVLDANGKGAGSCEGFSGKCEGVWPESNQCERIYAVYPNIWGYPAVNKYNLK
jgi:hypothetical protein